MNVCVFVCVPVPAATSPLPGRRDALWFGHGVNKLRVCVLVNNSDLLCLLLTPVFGVGWGHFLVTCSLNFHYVTLFPSIVLFLSTNVNTEVN